MIKGTKRFLAIAACITITCNTVNSATLNLDSNLSGTAAGGTGILTTTNLTSGTTANYTWNDSAVGSYIVNLTGGKLNVGGYSTSSLNGTLNATSGDLNVKDGTLTITKYDSIAGAVNTEVYDGATLLVKGGSVTLDDTDYIDGNITISRGSLALGDASKASSGIFTQTGGTTTITGTVPFNLNNSSDSISGGTLKVGTTGTGFLRVSAGTIETDANVNLGTQGNMRVSGGTVTVDSDDTWAGNIDVTKGTLNIDNATKTGTLTQTDGTINVTGKNFDLNSTSDLIDGGSLNIGNGSSASKLTVSQGTIDKDSTVTINSKGTLAVTGGTVALDSDDTWSGNVNVSGGSLALIGITKNSTGTFTQSNGSTTISGSGFDLNNENDYVSGGTLNIGTGTTKTTFGVSKGGISTASTVNLNNNATLNITGGTVGLTNKGNWSGNVNMTDGTLNVNSATKNTVGTITQTGGTTNVIGSGFDLNNATDSITGGTLNIGDGTNASSMGVSQGTLGSDTNVRITTNGTLNVNGGSVTLDNTDTWRGNVNVTDGTLELNNVNKNTKGTFAQTDGETTVTGTSFDLNNEADKVSGGTLNVGDGSTTTKLGVSKGTISKDATVDLTTNSTLNVSGGSVSLDNADTWTGDINVTNGSLALIGINNKNGKLIQTGGTTTVTGTGLNLNNSSDDISGGTLKIGDGTTASDITVSKGTIEKNATVSVDSNSAMTVSGGTVNLDNGDSLKGSLAISDGTLNLASVTKDTASTFSQSGGATTVTGTGFDLNNTQDKVAGGTLNIGNGTTVSDMTVSEGTIESDATVTVATNGTLKLTGGKVNLDSSDTWKGNISNTNGSLALVGITKNSAGTFTQTGGTTTVTGTGLDLNNTSDNITGGTLTVGDETTTTTLGVSKGTIAQDTATEITKNSTLNVTGGNVTLDGTTDKWNGTVNLTGGNLNLVAMAKDADSIFTQTAGTTTVTGTGTTLNNSSDNISGGTLNIGTSSTSGSLDVAKGTITSDAGVILNTKGTLNVTGGTATLDGKNDTWNGNVNVTDGTLNLSSNLNKTTTSDSKFTQSGGTTNIDNSKLVLNTSDSTVTGGTVNLTNSSTLDVNNSSSNTSALNSTKGKFLIRSGSSYTTTAGTVDEDSTVTVEKNGTLGINGTDAVVTLDGKGDNFAGNATLSSGTLNLADGISKTTTSTGTYNQTDGTLNISGKSTLALNESSSKITGGTVNVTDSSNLVVNNASSNTSKLNSTASNVTIKGKSTYTTTGGTVDSDSVVSVESASTLAINGDDASVTLNGKTDKPTGNLTLTNGTLYISDDLTKVTDSNGKYIQTGGKLKMDSSSLSLNDDSSKISGGDVALANKSTLTVTQAGGASITGGNVTIDDTSVLNYLAQKGLIQYTDGNAVNIDTSGLINMVNNVRTSSEINTLTVNNGTSGDGQANFAIDVYGRSNSNSSADTITANSIKVATAGTTGTIHISDWNLNGDVNGYDAPIDKSIRLGKIFNSNDIDSSVTFTATDKEVFTPIGYYKLNASSANDGSYTLDLTRFNPQVFRGQVATTAQYLNQMLVNDTLFNHAQIRNYAGSYGEMFKNKTAILDGSAKYEHTLKEGGIWYDMFGNFESMKLKQNLKVHNNAWGFIVGADLGLKELKSGWNYMPTLYVAYNGAHQTFNGVGLTENGGQIGFMSSWMKNDFTESALIYAGAYGTEMDVAGTTDNSFNYFMGLASKSAVDIKMGKYFKMQPSITLGYNMFGKQNWHADFGQMSMTSGFLNGFNIAPGLNFIMQRENWSLYATFAYVFNINTAVDGKAGNVDLPDMELSKGYLQYGFGMTKSVSDRFMMYAQATVRNIGRNGIVCQGGFNWRL